MAYWRWLLRVKVYGGISEAQFETIPMRERLESWLLYRIHAQHERAQQTGGAGF